MSVLSLANLSQAPLIQIQPIESADGAASLAFGISFSSSNPRSVACCLAKSKLLNFSRSHFPWREDGRNSDMSMSH